MIRFAEIGMHASIDVKISLISPHVPELEAKFMEDISFSFSNAFAHKIVFFTLNIFYSPQKYEPSWGGSEYSD